jgi:hypothetical protein
LLSLFRSIKPGTQEFLIEILTIKGRGAGLGITAVVAKNVREGIFIHAIQLVLHVTVEIIACLGLFIRTHEIILVLNLKTYSAPTTNWRSLFWQALVVRVRELAKVFHDTSILIFGKGSGYLKVIHGKDIFLAYLSDLNAVKE